MKTDNIGVKIKRLREAQKWSQEELASKLGVAQTRVSAIESGKPDKIDFLLMEKVCTIFNVDFSYFLNPNKQKQIIKGENNNGYMADSQTFHLSEKVIEQFELRIIEKDKYIQKLEEIINKFKS